MLKEFTLRTPVYLVTGYADLRRGIDGLAAIVQGKFTLDPYSRALFLFCGRRRDRIKGLLWEGDGFFCFTSGWTTAHSKWPRNEMKSRLLTAQETSWLLDGLALEQPKAIRPGRKGTLY